MEDDIPTSQASTLSWSPEGVESRRKAFADQMAYEEVAAKARAEQMAHEEIAAKAQAEAQAKAEAKSAQTPKNGPQGSRIVVSSVAPKAAAKEAAHPHRGLKRGRTMISE